METFNSRRGGRSSKDSGPKVVRIIAGQVVDEDGGLVSDENHPTWTCHSCGVMGNSARSKKCGNKYCGAPRER